MYTADTASGAIKPLPVYDPDMIHWVEIGRKRRRDPEEIGYYACGACGKKVLRYPSQIRDYQPTCSHECRNKVRNARRVAEKNAKKTEAPCPHCGKILLFRLSSKRTFCSVPCEQKFNRIVRTERHRAEMEAKKIDRPCTECGKILHRLPSKKNAFCERACMRLHSAKMRRSKKIVIKCKHCGKAMRRLPARIRGTRISCSKRCWHQLVRKEVNAQKARRKAA